MSPTSYHNTNGLTGDKLRDADGKAKTQEQIVLDIFKRLWNQWITRFSLQREYKRVTGKEMKDNVASRVLSNLTENDGPLEKSAGSFFPGEYEGTPVHAWRLRMQPKEDLFDGSANKSNQDLFGGMQ